MILLEIAGLILAALVTGFVLLLLVSALRLRGMRSAFQARVDAMGDAELTSQANLFGQASAGKSQLRGPGTLVLTQSDLVFVQHFPARELVVNRDAITSARLTRHFLGKTQGRDLLVVMWEIDGLGDAAAFDIADSTDWIARLS